jgi:hypothetical protein
MRLADSRSAPWTIGALAIRRLTIQSIGLDRAENQVSRVQDLTVTPLRAAEVIVSDTLKLPAS